MAGSLAAYRAKRHFGRTAEPHGTLKNGQAGGFLAKATLPDGRELGNGPGREP